MAATGPGSGLGLLAVAASASAGLAAVAWWLPTSKSGAVFGRLDFSQFAVALIATTASMLIALIAFAVRIGRRRMAYRLGAVGLGTAGALAGWETVVRWLPPTHAMNNPWYLMSGTGIAASADLPFERPPHLHWRGLSKGDLATLAGDEDPCAQVVEFATDRGGFRNAEETNRADVVFIGDSFTEAGNVSEAATFVRRTAKLLGRSARNLGRAGYSPPTELVVLRKYGLAIEPRLVVWQFAEANDLNEAAQYRDWLAAGRPPFPASAAARQGLRSPTEWLSPTYRWYCRLRRPNPWPLVGTFRDKVGRDFAIRFLEFPGPEQSPIGHPGWPLVEQALREGAGLLRDRGIALVVLLIPSKARAMGHAVALTETTRARIGEHWDLPVGRTLAAALGAVCSDLKVDFVDATAPLGNAAKQHELVYLPLDTHLSPLGHQVVAQSLVKAIARRLRETNSPPAP